MTSASPAEHFVTLFDSHYLPQGLCLHQSLVEHSLPFHLWIVAIDDACADALGRLALAHVTVLRLGDVETDALRAVKPGRTVGEYCWTLTPFLPSAVFGRAPDVKRVTYVDADVYFLAHPRSLICELDAAGKEVLITEHAFAPEYESHARFGRFCVQFVTFRNSPAARRVLEDWQRRCLDWCFAHEENGKFGDQKYLDDWPRDFGAVVHVLERADRTLAPWNVRHMSARAGGAQPTLYHFHSLKIVSRRIAVLYYMYRIGRRNRWIYDRYVANLRVALQQMRAKGVPVVARPLFPRWRGRIRFVWTWLTGRAGWTAL
jgi:hypothetical protein